MSCLGVTGNPMVVKYVIGVIVDFMEPIVSRNTTIRLLQVSWVRMGILRMDFPAIWILYGPRTMRRTLRGSY